MLFSEAVTFTPFLQRVADDSGFAHAQEAFNRVPYLSGWEGGLNVRVHTLVFLFTVRSCEMLAEV